MVDSQSWLQHSGRNEGHLSGKENLIRAYIDCYYRETAGDGCECRACEGIVGKPSPALPVRDFFWGGEQHRLSINLNDEFYLLCRPVVGGYALNERKWGMQDII